jgi:hypothetical protein
MNEDLALIPTEHKDVKTTLLKALRDPWEPRCSPCKDTAVGVCKSQDFPVLDGEASGAVHIFS